MRSVLFLSSLLATPALAANVTYVSDQSDEVAEAGMQAGLETAVKQFTWAIRGFVRPKLQVALHRCKTYTVDRGDKLTWRCDDGTFITRGPSEVGTWTNSEGKSYKLSMKRTGDVWLADFNDGGSGKRITYTFAGDTLTVVQEVYSSQMSEPMSWTLTYAKQ